MVQGFTSFLIKYLVEIVLLMNQIISLQKNFIGRLFIEKFIHRLQTIFGFS